MTNAIARRIWNQLAQPRTGVVSSMIIAGWCGLGSALGRWVPNFYHRHLIRAWWAPRWQTLWLLGLSLAIAVWGVHALFWLRRELSTSACAEGRSNRTVAYALLQVALVFGLGSYTWFVVAAPPEEFEVTPEGVDIHGEFYRALRINGERREFGPRQPIVAWLERRVGATTEELRVERAKWWLSRHGSHELALAYVHTSNRGAVFRHGNERVTLEVNRPVQQGPMTWLLRGFLRHPQARGSEPHHAELEINGRDKKLALDPEWAGENAFLGMNTSPVVVLRVHRNLTFTLMMWAVGLFGAAVLAARFELRLRSRKGT